MVHTCTALAVALLALVLQCTWAFMPVTHSRSCLVPTAPAPAKASLHTRQAAAAAAARTAAQERRRCTVRAMFSGIVEEQGRVLSLERNPSAKLWDGSIGEGVELTIEGDVVLDGAYLGCSIAVNGVCLTVTEFDAAASPQPWFRVGLAPETLRRSNLRDVAAGSKVNLERALASGARNSGHFVQGHVDDTGTILSFTPEGDSLWVKVQAPRDLMRFIVPKGFIAIDGTSLTVCEVNAAEAWFTFMLVAYTQAHIVLPTKAVGDKVNIEVDVLGKYVERSLAAVLDRLDALESAAASASPKSSASAATASGEGSVEYRLGAVESKVTNRDLIIDSVEARLDRIEKQLGIQ